jgi:hypothetical protein
MVNTKVTLLGLIILILGIFMSGINYMIGLNIEIPIISSIVLPEFIPGISTAYIILGVGVLIFGVGLKMYH